jgi:hypothetical protein
MLTLMDWALIGIAVAIYISIRVEQRDAEVMRRVEAARRSY